MTDSKLSNIVLQILNATPSSEYTQCTKWYSS